MIELIIERKYYVVDDEIRIYEYEGETEENYVFYDFYNRETIIFVKSRHHDLLKNTFHELDFESAARRFIEINSDKDL